EDGIRDRNVTGVQTCALPIYPLGLNAEQVREDPRQAVVNAHQYNTRKSVRQGQAGTVYEHGFGNAQTVRLMAYGGEREVLQFLRSEERRVGKEVEGQGWSKRF